MADFEVTYISTDELDPLGYPKRIDVEKVPKECRARRSYRPDDIALLQQTEGGQIRCSCCGRQLKREYISNWSKPNRGWKFCNGCGARIVGTEWD